jgi:hypothetical protein
MSDFATLRLRVNATNKNKRVRIERRCFERMKSPPRGRAGKNVLAVISAAGAAIGSDAGRLLAARFLIRIFD